MLSLYRYRFAPGEVFSSVLTIHSFNCRLGRTYTTHHCLEHNWAAEQYVSTKARWSRGPVKANHGFI